MVNLATFYNSSEKLHYIIYDLAAYDLGVFLTSIPGEMRAKRNESASPARTNSRNLWPGNLILEISNLADALDYLHKRLYSTNRIALAHNDIRPENILVVYPDSYDTDDHYPAGKWKIADFGLSKIKEKHASDKKHLSVDAAAPLLMKAADRTHRLERSLSFSRTKPKRDPGRYTSPELDQNSVSNLESIDARSADIWSFGCVLAEVLAYAVGLDPKLVEDFRTALGQGYRDQRFYDVKTKQVKKAFPDYLATLADPARTNRRTSENTGWIDQGIQLVKEVVVTDVSARPSAEQIRDKLRLIECNMAQEKKLWLEPDLHVDTSVANSAASYSPTMGNASAVESPQEMRESMVLPAKGDVLRGAPDIVISHIPEDMSSSLNGDGRARRKTSPR